MIQQLKGGSLRIAFIFVYRVPRKIRQEAFFENLKKLDKIRKRAYNEKS